MGMELRVSNKNKVVGIMSETQLYFWRPLIEKHKQELSFLVDYYNKTKVQFDNIEQEAREYAESLSRKVYIDEDTDIADVIAWISELEIKFYEKLLRMKSNHFLTVIFQLYQTWEQQIVKFTIKEMRHYFDVPSLEYDEVQKIFKLHGVDITKTKAWPKLRELKLLANTIKHGEGASASKLRKIRPDFFVVHGVDILKLRGSILLEEISLQVKESDFFEYVEATIAFWDEMPERAFADEELLYTELLKMNR